MLVQVVFDELGEEGLDCCSFQSCVGLDPSAETGVNSDGKLGPSILCLKHSIFSTGDRGCVAWAAWEHAVHGLGDLLECCGLYNDGGERIVPMQGF